MKNQRKKAFTLVELMIVIIIIWLMALLSYAPYNLYQKKAQLRVASREVSQALYESKNMAVSWVSEKTSVSTEKKNKIVILHLSTENSKNNKIDYYLKDFSNFQDEKWDFKANLKSNINDSFFSDKFKTKDLQKSIWIKGLEVWTWWKYSEILIFYAASSWNIKILWKNSSWYEISWNELKIILSYQNTDSDFLKKTLTYYLKTNIVDYSK